MTTRSASKAIPPAAEAAADAIVADGVDDETFTIILSYIKPPMASTLARCVMVSRSFAMPGGIVEQALRLRAAGRSQPTTLPKMYPSWLQKLLWDERLAAMAASAISVGRTHGAVVHAGRVFIFGTEYVSACGRECPGVLGVGLRNLHPKHVFAGNINEPAPLANVSDAVSVSCGREHTLALSADGAVFAWGNAEWGQCGDAKGRARLDFFPPTAQPEYLRGKHVYTDTGTFGRLKDGYWSIDTLYSIEDDLPIARCAQCANCPHDRQQMSGIHMADNYGDGGHPDGPFGMLPPAFVVPVPRPIYTPCKVLKAADQGTLRRRLMSHAAGRPCAHRANHEAS